MLTRDPQHNAARFESVVPVPTLRFPWPPEDRARYLGEIREVLDGRTDALPPEDQVFALIEALRGVDHIRVDLDAIPVPPVFGWLAGTGRVAAPEMLRTFNCGIGMAVIVAAEEADGVVGALEEAGETVFRIGRVQSGAKGCTVTGSRDAWSAREAWTAEHDG